MSSVTFEAGDPVADHNDMSSAKSNKHYAKNSDGAAQWTELDRAIEHVLFPAVKARLVATKGLLKAVMEVANLKGLYRVFERC